MANDLPLISVIMPVYNTEAYLKEAIESILNQTFYNFEFIIIDDGSTDSSLSVLKSFQDKRIHLLQNEKNTGNYPSRNRGIQIAKGKYIAVMDSDDIALPERLEKQYTYLEEHPEIVALGSAFKIIPVHPEKMELPLLHDEICFSMLRNFTILHPSLMARTEIIQQLNGYNQQYRYASDYDLFCRLSLKGKMENLPDVLMNYRRHPEQISQSYKKDQNNFADKIRQKYQLDFINHYREDSQQPVTPEVVSISTLGLAICCYTYARRFNIPVYEEEGDQLLDVIYKITTKDLPVCLENGLCGLAYGLLYLLRNGFVEGEEDEILENIDKAILTTVQNEPSHPNRKDQLSYLTYRLAGSPAFVNQVSEFNSLLS